MVKKVIIYGLLLAVLTICLKLLEYKLVIIDHSLELYGGVLALFFTAAGIYAGNRLTTPKEIVIENTIFVPQPAVVEVPASPEPGDHGRAEQMGISRREYEILELMAQGYSNQEIADRAYVSVNTVKTHVSNLFVKLDVQRRTQAVKKARELRLIA